MFMFLTTTSSVALIAIPRALFAMQGHNHKIVSTPEVWYVLPFIGLLLAIAIIPLWKEHFWESNLNKGIVSALFALPVAAYYLFAAPQEVVYHLEEYFGFIVLLWSLYTISGGIVLKGNILATPKANTIFLAIGAVIANLFGTTGAAMLLIRPVLKTNMERRHKKHIPIFFIFIVCNIAGCLTPLADPPLYMGYLNHIPFHWTFYLFPEWLFMNVLLLVIFYFWDRRAYAKESQSIKVLDISRYEPVSISGKINFLFIAGVLLTIIFGKEIAFLITSNPEAEPTPYREVIMIAMSLLSMLFTKKEYRNANNFNFGAIIEVAVLFAGIFITMIPALILLEHKGGEFGVNEPWQFFWMTGGLSSFLDNTPTYLTYVSLAKGVFGLDAIKDLAFHEHADIILRAISLGAVFMGANTYIGNGPNFMVKAISDQKSPFQVKTPSFFGFMLYSAGILLPLFIAVTFIFFV